MRRGPDHEAVGSLAIHIAVRCPGRYASGSREAGTSSSATPARSWATSRQALSPASPRPPSGCGRGSRRDRHQRIDQLRPGRSSGTGLQCPHPPRRGKRAMAAFDGSAVPGIGGARRACERGVVGAAPGMRPRGQPGGHADRPAPVSCSRSGRPAVRRIACLCSAASPRAVNPPGADAGSVHVRRGEVLQLRPVRARVPSGRKPAARPITASARSAGPATACARGEGSANSARC